MSRIQAEIKQEKPFQSVGQEAVIALLRTADVVRRHFERLVAAHGITLQQYNVLRILRGAGPEGLHTLEIGERLVERTPGITRLIDRLEAKALVRRERDTRDRRCVTCVATAEGLKVLAELDPVIDRADEEAIGMLPEAEQKALVRLLDSVRRTLEPPGSSPREII